MECSQNPGKFNIPMIRCTLRVETRLNNGDVRQVTYEKSKIILGRNTYKEMCVRVEHSSARSHVMSWTLNNFTTHKRFVKEGKATISLPDKQTFLMISNVPPNELHIFLKCLQYKELCKDTKPLTPRQTLDSRGPLFQEISPLTLKDFEEVRRKTGRPPLGEINNKQEQQPGSSPVVRAKRKIVSSPIHGRQDKENFSGPKQKVRRILNPKVFTDEQKAVLKAVKAGGNVFFTGSAGTGKSFLLQYLVGLMPPENTYITASTGIAASHIGGSTLHAFAGIGNGEGTLEDCKKKASRKTIAQQWMKCRHLIVDEVSMVDGNFFEKLEAIARYIKRNDKPFGGIQLILCGDFLQLPPVTKDGAKRVFCFQTRAWEDCIQHTLELTNVKRQDDKEFIRILQAIRLGVCTQGMARRLKDTVNNDVESNGIKATRLCTHRVNVDYINTKNLMELEGKERVFMSIDNPQGYRDQLDNNTPVNNNLKLKIGCQVVLLKNIDVTAGLCNGAQGVVTSFAHEGKGNPIVRFRSGVTREITLEKWTMIPAPGLYVTRRQLPLKLAWAFSIHKSQGMTLECAEMSFTNVFEAGQVYVALSRVRNLKGLRVLDFDSSSVRADSDVVKFYGKLRREQQDRNNYGC